MFWIHNKTFSVVVKEYNEKYVYPGLWAKFVPLKWRVFIYMPFVEIWIDKIPWMFWMFKVSIFSFPITLCFCLGWCCNISNDYANILSNYTKHLFVFHNTSDDKKQDRFCTTWMPINLTIIRQIYERTLLGLWAISLYYFSIIHVY